MKEDFLGYVTFTLIILARGGLIDEYERECLRQDYWSGEDALDLVAAFPWKETKA